MPTTLPLPTVRDRYLADRRTLAERYGPQDLWRAVDAWPLYVGVGNLARTLVLMRALEMTADIPGDCMEFGSWRGSTLLLWAKLLVIREPLGAKRVHGFDRWAEGFEPSQWTPEDAPASAEAYAGTYRGERAVIEDMLALYGLAERVVLHQGRIEDTWPAAREAIPRVSLVLLDVDLYGPTRCALEGLHERLSPGAVILADEYGCAEWPGETAAVDEFLAAHVGEYRLRAIPNTIQPTLWIERRG